MAIADVDQLERLAGSSGFIVESPEGEIGWVEEIWLGERGAPRALAVCTGEGRRGLVLVEDVLSVDDEHEWVVVRAGLPLLELAPPRIAHTAEGTVVASWATTGETLVPTPARLPGNVRRRVAHAAAPPAEGQPRPLSLSLFLLFGGLVLLAAAMMTLAFVVAKLVTGAAY